MDQIPFPEIHQLESHLQLDLPNVPTELCGVDRSCKSLPGQPRVRLGRVELGNNLKKDLSLPELDQLAPRLWLVRFNLFLQTMPHRSRYIGCYASGASGPKYRQFLKYPRPRLLECQNGFVFLL